MVYRIRPGPIRVCIGLGGFLLVLTAAVDAAVLLIRTPDQALGPALWLALLLTVLCGAPGLFILNMGLALSRARVVIRDDGVDLTANRFRIWGLRRMASAQLSWSDILGVQSYETPNFAAPGGVQVDYVLHTTHGLFTVPNIQFAQAAEIAATIAARIGRPIGELPAGVAPVSASRPVDRVGIRLMRGLGWVSLGLGILLPLTVVAIWASGEKLEASTLSGVSMASLTLLLVGRSLRRFSLK